MTTGLAMHNATVGKNYQWRGLTRRAGRNDLPIILAHYWEGLAVEDKPTALSQAWGLAEYPEANLELDIWVSMFEDVGYMVDGETIDRAEDPDLPADITLWRGCVPERRHGMSWSLDKDRALWFANRWNGYSNAKTALYRIDIPHEFVLARITTRGEDEAVVDTSTFDDDEYIVVSADAGTSTRQ